MLLHEIADERPMIWQLVDGLREKGKRVSIAALMDVKSGGVPGWHNLTGEITSVGSRAVEIWAFGRTWYCVINDDDDERYTIEKDDNSDFYWVFNHQPEKVDESADMPMVWSLAALQLGKGERVMFHGHMPDSSSYLVGKVLSIGVKGARIKNIFNRTDPVLTVHFTPDDDENLTFARTNDSSVADWVIRDHK